MIKALHTHFVLVLLLSLELMTAYGQKSESGPKVPLEGSVSPEMILGESDGAAMVMFNLGNGRWKVIKHDPSLAKSKELSIDLKDKEPNLIHEISGGGILGTHPYLLVKSVDDKLRKSMARLVWLNDDLSGYDIQDIGTMYIESRRKSGVIHSEVSEDAQTLAITMEPPMESGEPWIWQAHVYGVDKSKKWNKDFTVSAPGKPSPSFLMSVGNEGQVHILKNFRKDQDYRFLLYTIDADLSHHRTSELDVPGLKITDVKLAIGPEDQVYAGGLTTTTQYYDQPDGWFLIAFDKMGNQTAVRYESLSNPADKGRTTLLEYLCVMTDGRPVLVAEHYSESSEKSRSSDGYDYVYTHGNAYVIWPDLQGSSHGYFEISKEQTTVNDASLWSSCEAFVSEDVFHLIYNEAEVEGRKREQTFGTTRYYVMSGPKPDSGIRNLGQAEGMMVVPGYAQKTSSGVYLIAMDANKSNYSLVVIKDPVK